MSRYEIRFSAFQEPDVIDRLFGHHLEAAGDFTAKQVSKSNNGTPLRWAIQGTGDYGKKCLKRYGPELTIFCFFDNFPNAEGRFCDLDVYRPEEFSVEADVGVVVTNGNYQESVFQLLALGYSFDNIRVFDRESMKILPVNPETLEAVR